MDGLEPTDFAGAVCKVTEWYEFKHHGAKAYRIWKCRNGMHWFTRHEWQIEGRNSTQLDDWIYSVRRRPDFPAHFQFDGFDIIEKETQ